MNLFGIASQAQAATDSALDAVIARSAPVACTPGEYKPARRWSLLAKATGELQRTVTK